MKKLLPILLALSINNVPIEPSNTIKNSNGEGYTRQGCKSPEPTLEYNPEGIPFHIVIPIKPDFHCPDTYFDRKYPETNIKNEYQKQE